MNKQSTILTLQEAAHELKCHPNTLRTWDREGILPAIRFGKRGDRRYRRKDIHAFIRSRSVLIDPQSNNPSEVEKTLRQIYDAGLRLLVPKSLQKTYKTITNEACRLVSGDYGSIYLYENHELSKVYTSLAILNEIKPRKDGHTYQAFKQRKVYVIDVTTVEEHASILRHLDIKSTVFIPLAYDGMSIGVLSIDSCHHSFFTPKTLEMLKLFGSLAALKIMNTQLYSQLTEALETRDLFISLAAHELKTPLTSIHGYAQLIEKKAANHELPPIKWIQMLVRETTRARGLIGELLHVEQIKTKKLQFRMRKSNLMTIVHRSIQSFGIMHPKRKILFEKGKLESKPYIQCDVDKLLQVLMNLYNNAAKFSGHKSPITVSLNECDTAYLLNIKDEGKGISQAEIEKIFTVFYKGKQNTKEGLGLGLYLSKHIIEKHNGTINVKSQLGKGTMITITLNKLSSL